MENVVSQTVDSTASLGLSGLRASIAALVPGLRPSEAKVLRLVLDDPEFVVSATTEETARRAGVSPATVVRGARGAGFAGLRELKLALARASGRGDSAVPFGRLESDAGVAEVSAVVLGSHASSVRAAQATLDPAALRGAVSLLSKAREILVVGVGTSAAPAADAAYRWTTIGCRAQAPADMRMAILKAHQLTANDVLVAISHTGSSPETLTAVDAAAAAEAPVVAITSFAASALVNKARLVLVAGGPDLGINMASASSRLAHLAVIDILHACIGLADLTRARRVGAATCSGPGVAA